ncbi:MAG: ATP-dependent zinc metalloprotease FtsH [Ignavibacteria bacterium]|nr:ATP-dependent zinc metalloprotease FtsH [Ignavibacteria bacterium]
MNGSKDKQNRNNQDFNWGRVFRIVITWSIIIIGFFIVMIYTRSTDSKYSEISYNQFDVLVKNKKVKSAVVKIQSDKSLEFSGELVAPDTVIINNKPVANIDKVSLILPQNDEIIKQIKDNIANVEFKQEESSWATHLIGVLPWILIIVVWIFIMRRMQGGSGGTRGLFSFGKSKAKMLTASSIKVTFQDVAGADEAKVELSEIIEFLRSPGKFQKLGGKIPRGVLLLGPPGTGKTLLARAVAGEAGVPFFSISGADFVEMFVGVGASRVRDLFEQGKKNAPCIIFIDEIDAVGRHRGAGLGGGHDEREQTLNQLLIEMDGFEQNSGVIVIAATNRPDILDPALLRPGRFDRQVVVDRPDVKGREGILKVHTKKIPLAKDIKLEVIAKGTPGFSGADLANLVNEAALLAARRDSDSVTMKDLEDAKDKVLMGTERKSLIISDKEKRTTAYHEAGHVLVAKMIPEADPVHKVTIIPRGRALGVTTYLPMDEKHTYSKEYLEAMIAYAMGGRAAEKLVFNEFTTGASNDIERATGLARKMVCEFGMSEKLGPVAFGNKQEEVFLGKEIHEHKNYSEQTQILIDEEIKRFINNGIERAERIVKNNIDSLHRLANALLEREILDSDEIDILMKGGTLPPPEKNGNNQEEVKDESGKKISETAVNV